MSENLASNEDFVPFDAIFHPKSQVVFNSFEDYAKWYIKEENIDDYNWIGILTHRNNWINKNLEIENSLIEAFELLGLKVIPVFSYASTEKGTKVKNFNEIIKEYFSFNCKLIIGGLVNFQMIAAVSNRSENIFKQSVEIFKKMNIPVFKPLISYKNDEKTWRDNICGLSSEIAWLFNTPEMVGMIEPIIIGCKNNQGKYIPINERINKFSKRVFNWIKLKNTPNNEKKLAIFINNSPCSGVEATIGTGVGLEVFESIIRILNELKKEGYYIKNIPKSGYELHKMIMDKKAYSDFRWTCVEDIVEAGGCIYEMPLDDHNGYMEFYNVLDKEVRTEIEEMWGKPPGEGMVYDGKLVITGINFGNITIIVQPKRGCYGAKCTGEVCKILHDPKCLPPHQYMATYRYIEEVLKANAVINVGTGGSLEYLPGKTNALSNRCYPDIVIGTLPNLYIYNAGIGGEGMSAKRRAYSVILDYLPASIAVDIDNYKVSNMIGEYLEAEVINSKQKNFLKKTLEIKIKEIKGAEEIVNSETSFINGVKKLNDYLVQSISNSRMQKLHIFGKSPEFKEIVSLIKEYIDNSENGILVRNLSKSQYIYDIAILELISEVISFKEKLSIEQMSIDANVINELKLEILQVYKKLIVVEKEIKSVINALNANFIEPGLSGMPNENLKNILPTGRNFYLMDCEKIPSREAYEVGRELAEKLIEKYVEDEGKLPEKVAMNMISTDISMTKGEMLSQILYLMGVIPIWDKNGKVTGIDIIPLKELRRSRIDVTVRISGVLRDSYPQVISLIDKAAILTSSLDEPLESNFIRKNTLEIEKYLKNIGEDENIKRRSTIRIFGDKPGAYGAGVNLALKASAWKDEKDLAKVFAYFSSYAYGEELNGCNAKHEFIENVKTSDISYGTTTTKRYDVLTSSFSSAVQGGFEMVKKALTGNKIKQYHGSSENKHKIKVITLKDEISNNLEETFFNPLWKESVKEKGYIGAAEFMKKIQNVFEWQCVCENIDDEKLDKLVNTYINDEKMIEWFNKYNKYAIEEISRRFLELHERKKWNADKETLSILKRNYLEIEGNMEELGENSNGEIQGGNVEILNQDDINIWKSKLSEIEKIFK